MTECRDGKFGTLLIKSRSGRNRGIILKKFEKFMIQASAFHGNDQMHHFLKIKFAFADKIFTWIVSDE